MCGINSFGKSGVFNALLDAPGFSPHRYWLCECGTAVHSHHLPAEPKARRPPDSPLDAGATLTLGRRGPLPLRDHFRSPLLNTFPSFITNSTLPNSLMSLSGSPGTATMSA